MASGQNVWCHWIYGTNGLVGLYGESTVTISPYIQWLYKSILYPNDPSVDQVRYRAGPWSFVRSTSVKVKLNFKLLPVCNRELFSTTRQHGPL